MSTSEYLNIWLGSAAVQHMIQLTASQYAAQGGIYLEQVANLPLALPDLKVQSEILEHLAPRIISIDKLMNVTSRSIAKLQEYRQALITAAVTGQIEIPVECTA